VLRPRWRGVSLRAARSSRSSSFRDRWMTARRRRSEIRWATATSTQDINRGIRPASGAACSSGAGLLPLGDFGTLSMFAPVCLNSVELDMRRPMSGALNATVDPPRT